MATVNIEGLNKGAVLAALYNNSKVLGEMTIENANDLLKETTYFHYLNGKGMEVNLESNESFDSCDYDISNGNGAAQAVVDSLR